MVTFFFIVGGSSEHYDNLKRCIESLKQLSIPYRVKILEIGTSLSSCDNITVINKPEIIDFSKKAKIGFKFWQQKYNISRELDTEYGIYLDTDTVLVNDNILGILDNIGERFGVAQHFWVPSFSHYEKQAVPTENLSSYITLKEQLNIKNGDLFFAGGVFFFKNTQKNISILSDVSKLYEEIYPESSEYIRGITDEVFFSNILKKERHFCVLNGAVNHCCMGESYMPIELRDGVLFGRNPFEYQSEPITFFHCDPSRRDPSLSYSGEIKEKIKKYWNLV